MKPRIFISSTFYDLKYIREELSNFVEAHDFEPIMFENGDIGYTPGKPLDESCYEAMRNTDIVILIIGGQYGSAASGEKVSFNEYMSVTRNEFKTAVANGIPVYSFIDSSVYSEYGVYEANIQNIEEKLIPINFAITKDVNVFRFIKHVKSIGKIPIIEFKKANDIKDFLSKQWSDMFKNYLTTIQDHKKIEQLQYTMMNMQSLVEKMELMLDGLGKKIFSNDQEELADIRIKQDIIGAVHFINNNFMFFLDDNTRKQKIEFIDIFLKTFNDITIEDIHDINVSDKLFAKFPLSIIDKIGVIVDFDTTVSEEILNILSDKDYRLIIREKLLETI